MADRSSNRVTELLQAAGAGDRQAAADLLPLVYRELRRLAEARMARERRGGTLQPTALVHEAYVRLVEKGDPGWEGKGHFFAAAAEAMRRVLVERARSRGRHKRGGGLRRTTLDDGAAEVASRPAELLDLDRALEDLEARDAEMARTVKLRFFVGLTVPETAELLGVSERSVNRQWTAARAWLTRRIESSPEAPSC